MAWGWSEVDDSLRVSDDLVLRGLWSVARGVWCGGIQPTLLPLLLQASRRARRAKTSPSLHTARAEHTSPCECGHTSPAWTKNDIDNNMNSNTNDSNAQLEEQQLARPLPRSHATVRIQAEPAEGASSALEADMKFGQAIAKIRELVQPVSGMHVPRDLFAGLPHLEFHGLASVSIS